MSSLRLGLAGAILAAATVMAMPGLGESAPGMKRRDRRALAEYAESIGLQRAALTKTQGLLATKLTTRQAEMKRRLRAIYKLSRANWPRLWFEPEARRESARWLGASRRVAMRDIHEIAMLHDEIAMANRADERLVNEGRLAPATAPRPKSMQWPVQGTNVEQAFGLHKGPSHRVKLRSRGLRLASERGQAVFSIDSGRVRYLGPIRGLGTSLIIEHDSTLSILGGLKGPSVVVGDTVTRDTVVGTAAGPSIYLEVRLNVGQRGLSIDPEPLLADVE